MGLVNSYIPGGPTVAQALDDNHGDYGDGSLAHYFSTYGINIFLLGEDDTPNPPGGIYYHGVGFYIRPADVRSPSASLYLADSADFGHFPAGTPVTFLSELLGYEDKGGPSLRLQWRNGLKARYIQGNERTRQPAVRHPGFTANAYFLDGHAATISQTAFGPDVVRGADDCIWDDQ